MVVLMEHTALHKMTVLMEHVPVRKMIVLHLFVYQRITLSCFPARYSIYIPPYVRNISVLF
jgi:hypothetical protein